MINRIKELRKAAMVAGDYQKVDICNRAIRNDSPLRDSETGYSLSSDELGIGVEKYVEYICESLDSSEGYIFVSGRKVYAA